MLNIATNQISIPLISGFCGPYIKIRTADPTKNIKKDHGVKY